jgi:hypothetical protein
VGGTHLFTDECYRWEVVTQAWREVPHTAAIECQRGNSSTNVTKAPAQGNPMLEGAHSGSLFGNR